MKFPLRFLLPAIGFAVLVGFFIVGLRHDPGQIPSPLIGKAAPGFAIETLANPDTRVGPANYRGQPWLLNVWATWCGGCRQEHSVLLAMAREQRVPIVGLNWRDDRALAMSWLEQLGDPYATVAYDPEGHVAIDWGVYGAPETFLIDASERVIKKQIGPMTTEIWEREFVPLLPAATARP